MNKTNLGVNILTGISIIGLIVLIGMDKQVDVISNVVTALIGFMAGSNKDAIVGVFKRK